MPPKDLAALDRAVDLLGDKWTLLILGQIFAGVQRFSELARNLGVARNLLSARLKLLTEAGILERHQYRSEPDFYEYRLTRKGQAAEPVLKELIRWAPKQRR
jgi:DNA-binding HxlR family transcriptional regulator